MLTEEYSNIAIQLMCVRKCHSFTGTSYDVDTDQRVKQIFKLKYKAQNLKKDTTMLYWKHNLSEI